MIKTEDATIAPTAPTPQTTTSLVTATVHPLPAQAASRTPEPAVQSEPVPTAPRVASVSHSASAIAAKVVDGSTATLSPDEVHLTEEIDSLWKAHTEAQGFLRLSREDAAKTRAALSKRLHELKSVLSRPGRGGAWFSFLKAQAIPRTSADRLVKAHEKSIAPAEISCTAGATTESPEVVIRRYLNGLWPKLSRVLTSREHVEVFVTELTQMAGKSFNEGNKAASPVASEDVAATV